MGKGSPKSSYKNMQKAAKSSNFAISQQAAKNTIFNRKDKKK